MIEREAINILVTDLINAINKYGNDKTPPSLSEFEPFFAPGFSMTRNVNPFCASPADFIQKIAHLQRELTKFKYHYRPHMHKGRLLRIDDEEENRAALYYEITAVHPKDKKIFCRVSANLHIIDGKVYEWREVLYTAGIGLQIFNHS